jgi:hypothetical protein
MKKTVCVVAIGISLSACISNSNPNALALGTLGAVAGGIGGHHIGKGKGQLVATGLGTLFGAATGAFIGNKWDTVNNNQHRLNTLPKPTTYIVPPQPSVSNNHPHRHTRNYIDNHLTLRTPCHVINNRISCGN